MATEYGGYMGKILLIDLTTETTEEYANANTTALIYAHQIAVARATASEVRAGVFANRK